MKTRLVKVMAAALIIASVSSCNKNRFSEEGISVIVKDSTLLQTEYRIRIDSHFDSAVRSLDVFVFETGENAALKGHYRDTSVFLTDGSPKTVCIILNCSYKFNELAIPTLEAFEMLSIDFRDDDPMFPVAATTVEISPDRDSVIEVHPSKLMCEIRLESVTNNLGGYSRLEDPKVYLLGASANAEPFRTKGFFPNSQLDTSEMKVLPNDVGIFTQYPGISLFCYPNESSSSANSTKIVFECNSGNEFLQCPAILPPMCKGSTLSASLQVDSSTGFYWNLSLNQLTLCD